MREELQSLKDAQFKIQGTDMQPQFNYEIAKLYVQCMQREPDGKAIAELIVKVMGREAETRGKFNIGKAYVKSRLTELRCEERRRVIGQKPHERYLRMTCREFSTSFLETIKAPLTEEIIEVYSKNVSVLRKFCIERGEEANVNTFVSFRKWLVSNPTSGDAIDEVDEYISVNQEQVEE